MPIISTKKDWWDTVDAYWDEILFLFHHHIGLDKVIEQEQTIQSELESLRAGRDPYISELLEMLYTHTLLTDEATDDILVDAVGILFDLHDSVDKLFESERVYKDKGRGNQIEGLKKNEGLEAKRAKFKAIMVSSWSKDL